MVLKQFQRDPYTILKKIILPEHCDKEIENGQLANTLIVYRIQEHYPAHKYKEETALECFSPKKSFSDGQKEKRKKEKNAK